nr:nucleotide exchange factor GrpE [Oceanococcus sp. HetDA_MAG_MS8]
MTESNKDAASQPPESAQADQASTEAGADSTVEVSVDNLSKALEEAQAKAEDNWQRFLRATAEQDNIRKRAERDVDQARRFALEKFSRDLIAVMDSLDLGLQSAEQDQPAEGGAKALLEGMQLTAKMLRETLGRHGIEVLNPEGESFDPAKHEAMSAVPNAEVAPNTVLNVVQKGYLLHERVLRPAMVVVAQAPADGNAS